MPPLVEGAAYTKSSDWQETRAPSRAAGVRGCGKSRTVVGPVVAPVVVLSLSIGNSRLRL